MKDTQTHNAELIGRSALLDYCDAKAFNALELWDGGRTREAWLEAFEAVRTAPTVDAVEVVRCKDCKAFGESPWGHFPKGWCKIHGRHRDPEYYCASGVRKDAEVEG